MGSALQPGLEELDLFFEFLDLFGCQGDFLRTRIKNDEIITRAVHFYKGNHMRVLLPVACDPATDHRSLATVRRVFRHPDRQEHGPSGVVAVAAVVLVHGYGEFIYPC